MSSRRMLVTPRSFERSKNRWSLGFRRSQLTAITRFPVCARATARFADVVVLPSPMLGLARLMDLRSLVLARKLTFVRRVRYASAGGVFGISRATSLVL